MTGVYVWIISWNLIENSRFNEHVGLEKLIFHVMSKFQFLDSVNHQKSSWGVPLILFSSKSRSLTLQWAKKKRKLCKWGESLGLCPCSVPYWILNLCSILLVNSYGAKGFCLFQDSTKFWTMLPFQMPANLQQ